MTDINETAKGALLLPAPLRYITFHAEGETVPAGTVIKPLPLEHLQAMARLWLMKDEIIEAWQELNYRHTKKNGDKVAALLAKLREI